MRMSMLEAISKLRNCSLLHLSMAELAGACQYFSLSGKGSREELTERLYRHIWLKKFDQYDDKRPWRKQCG